MNNKSHHIHTADLIIKPEIGEIEIGNNTIRLAPVNMKVLLKLVNQSGKVVSRAELFDSVWENQIISDDALTKSISEIRTKLAQYSNYKKLIVTVPKKGYQWCPSENISKQEKLPETVTQYNKTQTKSIAKFIKNALLLLASLAVLTTSFLWVANNTFESKYLPILLLPTESWDKSLQQEGLNLEDTLRKNILSSHKLRFLSKSVLNNSSQFSLFNHNNYRTQWALESRIRKVQDKLRYTISLIDTRTALEIYSQSIETQSNADELDKFCSNFIKAIEQRLGD